MKQLFSLIVFFLITLFSGCSGSSKFKRAYDPASIPSDLKKNGYILLVLKQEIGGFSGVQNRGVKKLMKRHYGAAFEMVSTEDLKDKKYDNTDVYRYVIGRDFNTGTVMTTQHFNSQGRTTMTTHREYHEETIFDRKTNQAFPSIGYPSASYSLGMKGFSKFMKKK